ncbi:FeoB-associated Cys-rich membrane protein [Dysosmobacter sp.]
MELFILAGLGLWLALALRSCVRRKGGCGGDCAHCRGCGK